MSRDASPSSTSARSVPEIHWQLEADLVAAGERHSILLASNGAVLTFGDGNCGQLGHGDWASCSHARSVLRAPAWYSRPRTKMGLWVPVWRVLVLTLEYGCTSVGRVGTNAKSTFVPGLWTKSPLAAALTGSRCSLSLSFSLVCLVSNSGQRFGGGGRGFRAQRSRFRHRVENALVRATLITPPTDTLEA
eukprot:762592-Rhodomonas_salina.1